MPTNRHRGIRIPLKLSWKAQTFNNSLRIGTKHWDKGWDLLDTHLWGNNLKQLGRVWLKAPQWWQTWVCLELLGFLEGDLTLEVDKDLNLGQLGLIWPTTWQWWQVETNSDFSKKKLCKKN